MSDFRFDDKVKKYEWYINNKGKYIGGTKIQDLLTIGGKYNSFDEKDIFYIVIWSLNYQLMYTYLNNVY